VRPNSSQNADYTLSVFRNCPFDAEYAPLLDAMVFAIMDCGFDKHEALPTDPARAVLGPLTQAEFSVEARSLQLPEFTKVLSSLE
jgi:hypothetical protein